MQRAQQIYTRARFEVLMSAVLDAEALWWVTNCGLINGGVSGGRIHLPYGRIKISWTVRS